MEHKAKILLADDSAAIRALISEILTDAGFDVITAEDGQDALDKIYKTNPDLLILDYEMPRKTGFEVVQDVRSHTGYLNIGAQVPGLALGPAADGQPHGRVPFRVAAAAAAVWPAGGVFCRGAGVLVLRLCLLYQFFSGKAGFWHERL